MGWVAGWVCGRRGGEGCGLVLGQGGGREGGRDWVVGCTLLVDGGVIIGGGPGLAYMPPSGQGLGAAARRTLLLVSVPSLLSGGQAVAHIPRWGGKLPRHAAPYTPWRCRCSWRAGPGRPPPLPLLGGCCPATPPPIVIGGLSAGRARALPCLAARGAGWGFVDFV